MTWQPEFFHLAGSWLACRNAALDYPAPLPDGSVYCPYGLMVGELAVQSEMHMVMREAGMLPAQRLARCAGRLLLREDGHNAVPSALAAGVHAGVRR
jgi:hypothetical protein